MRALAYCAPALLAISGVALFPLAYTLWESLHLHDLRMPWRGRPFIGFANYVEAFSDERFWGALVHTTVFALVSVSLELVLGLGLALLLHRRFFGRGVARTMALLPWAMPTVVVALVWRFLFEPSGAIDAVSIGLGLTDEPPLWLSDATLAWVPIVLADVWKTTPFVALLLLAGLSGVEPALYEAARIDGAGRFATLWHVTLPALRPTLAVTLVFRSVDALRVFDLIFVLTSGGPGTATEPLAMYSFVALLRNLRFGYGSALAVIVFVLTLALSLVYMRLARRTLLEDER
ncbi:MAG: sugar ABC transporter permease [Polyangiaceae bacterium]|nr:sugar ABC transporter permease [Polyangiaceae bacterium]